MAAITNIKREPDDESPVVAIKTEKFHVGDIKKEYPDPDETLSQTLTDLDQKDGSTEAEDDVKVEIKNEMDLLDIGPTEIINTAPSQSQRSTNEVSQFSECRPRPKQKITVCGYCGDSFDFQWQLERHVAIHRDRRPYVCDLCGMKYKRENFLIEHKQSHLENESEAKPFECSSCDMRFKRQALLTVHERVHNGKRQFACDHCGWDYTSSWALNSHLKSDANCRNKSVTKSFVAVKRKADFK